MALSTRCTGITVQEDGQINLTFDDGSGEAFADLTELQAFAAEPDAPENVRMGRKMLMAWFLQRSADASQVNLVVGKTLTFDMATAAMIEVS